MAVRRKRSGRKIKKKRKSERQVRGALAKVTEASWPGRFGPVGTRWWPAALIAVRGRDVASSRSAYIYIYIYTHTNVFTYYTYIHAYSRSMHTPRIQTDAHMHTRARNVKRGRAPALALACRNWRW